MNHRELRTEVCIVGGGTGGVAAALAVARAGRTCVVVEPTDWVGGQLTSQAVPPDENRWIEYEAGIPGANGSYLRFRDEVRRHYRERRPLTDAARANATLNPGNGWVSRLCHEPVVGHAVLTEMLAAHVAAGRVTVLLEYAPTAADIDGDRVRAVTARGPGGDEVTVRADLFLDASELGDLLPLAGAEYRVGAEGASEFGKLHGQPGGGDPLDQQAISWCFALEHRPGEDHTVSRPASYDAWRDYVPPFDTGWPGKLFSWTVVGGDKHEPREFPWRPWPQEPPAGELEMWRYRRIVDRSLYRPESADQHPDVALINMVQMDYFRRPTIDVSADDLATAFAEAREQSLAFLYWMQTEAPRFDGTDGVGYPGLRLRGDEIGTADGFAKYPYIREARRLEALFTVHEGHVGTEQRKREGRPNQTASPFGMTEPFPDSVGVGHYRLDLHPSTAMRNSVYAQAAPFRVPLGALIPKRVRNLVAAGKCLGVTHVTNGAYRLHPIEWAIGEAAGELAAFCLEQRVEPRQVREQTPFLRDLQSRLHAHEVPLAWPWEKGEGL